jgi:hypothetical protein
MALRIEVKLGNEIAFASMAKSPDIIQWSGNEDLIDDALFSLNFSYGAAGHNFVSGIETTALDVATALVHRYGQDNINVLEGVEILEKEEEELAKIEETGMS